MKDLFEYTLNPEEQQLIDSIEVFPKLLLPDRIHQILENYERNHSIVQKEMEFADGQYLKSRHVHEEAARYIAKSYLAILELKRRYGAVCSQVEPGDDVYSSFASAVVLLHESREKVVSQLLQHG